MQFLGKIAEKIRQNASKRGYSCDCCGAEVFEYPMKRLCEECEERLCMHSEKVCEKCGRQTVSSGVCLSCKQTLPKFDRGFSPFVYSGETAALVNRVKNGGRRLAYYFGEKMADEFIKRYAEILQKEGGRYATNEKNAPEGGTEALVLLPVPMDTARIKERGYNQAADLARIVCDRLQERGVAAEVFYDVLQKRKETKPQKHMTFAERAENVAGAYHVHKRKVCRDKTVLLIDDVMTTGATGSEIAARLLGAGAKRAFFLVAAALPEQK